ncbi:hypothetical protein DI09_110p40 [Mitosporidium daphniae]|uniref:Uncharacterized protein n=1 Tax=Mitosporidium daphniae TaxID=1485682 RepID=A0A098VW40_9MICR|nr:uncharacterized protein DI09_110p40 [Mitosporidium daphniae]KGG53094.1 hypothetical protein DI09_110p40 [Mitosporidium daphniae]|eukprot:XP_013239530.1 uncharacterized protein DI09_110p40 [Mitosporidium daphniae]
MDPPSAPMPVDQSSRLKALKPRFRPLKMGPTQKCLSKRKEKTSQKIQTVHLHFDDIEWVPLTNQDGLIGPLWLTFERDSERYSLSFSELGTISLVPLLVSDAQPSASHHVVVGQFIGDRSHFSIKTSHGKYLGFDKHGFVETTKEAIGPHELWIPIFLNDTDGIPCVIFKRKSYNTEDVDMHLQYDFSYKCLRADIEAREEATKFFIFHHSTRSANTLAKSSEAGSSAQPSIDVSNYEYDQMKRYVSWYDRKLSLGQLHSALLDRREKLKSDKYCK